MNKIFDKPKNQKLRFFIALSMSLLYWIWECQVSGNIRVDLLFIYPSLLIIYLGCLWPNFKFKSILMAIFLMLINIAVMILTYKFLNKRLG
jgi:hypothetical protein